VWSSDKEPDDNPFDPDFLAIIDATPRSRTYGKVLTTATLQDVSNTDLLDQLGLANNGISSNVLNEAQHMAHNPISENGHNYLFMGGLISANVFKRDVTSPLAIPTCPLGTSSAQVSEFSSTDDFIPESDSNLLVTYIPTWR